MSAFKPVEPNKTSGNKKPVTVPATQADCWAGAANLATNILSTVPYWTIGFEDAVLPIQLLCAATLGSAFMIGWQNTPVTRHSVVALTLGAFSFACGCAQLATSEPHIANAIAIVHASAGIASVRSLTNIATAALRPARNKKHKPSDYRPGRRI